jgi:hypothetical protein
MGQVQYRMISLSSGIVLTYLSNSPGRDPLPARISEAPLFRYLYGMDHRVIQLPDEPVWIERSARPGAPDASRTGEAGGAGSSALSTRYDAARSKNCLNIKGSTRRGHGRSRMNRFAEA